MRIESGISKKIDNINRLVSLSHSMNIEESKKALDDLLEIFKPMILKICKKWSLYFRDDSHTIISWAVLTSDAHFWFIYYTTKKYTINGSAVYNKFIKDHMNQRIRFIYETQIKYNKQNIFPDPNKNAQSDSDLGDVINRYCTNDHTDISESMISDENIRDKREVYDAILTMVNDPTCFTDRERLVFTECIVNGRTHESISIELQVSRTRVSQIMAKIRKKIREILDDSVRGWEEKICQ